jgi:hypothetical protein
MSLYVVTYRIDMDATYHERYKALRDALDRVGILWEETTSFALVRSGLDPDALLRSLTLSGWLKRDRDHLAVLQIRLDGYAVAGQEERDIRVALREVVAARDPSMRQLIDVINQVLLEE